VKEDFTGARPATVEPKLGKKKLKKLKKEEREKTKGGEEACSVSFSVDG
jgi:hypothetical protein